MSISPEWSPCATVALRDLFDLDIRSSSFLFTRLMLSDLRFRRDGFLVIVLVKPGLFLTLDINRSIHINVQCTMAFPDQCCEQVGVTDRV